MAIDIGRVLMELLAAIIIQFTPVDMYMDADSRTWGDGESRWYILEPAVKGKDTVQFTFTRYDGEVSSGDSLTLTARKGKDGVYVWERYLRDREKAPSAFTQGLKDAGSFGTSLRTLAPAVWSDPAQTIPLIRKTQGKRGGEAATQLLFATGDDTVAVILTGSGLWGCSLSSSRKGYDDAEYRLEIE